MTEPEKGRRERAMEVGREAVSLVTETAEAAAGTVMENIGAIRNKTAANRQTRDNVVMVRVDKDSLARMDELVEAEVVGSRSEAAAYLITAGINARQGLFDAIATKVAEIRKAKDELKKLLEEEEQPEARPQD